MVRAVIESTLREKGGERSSSAMANPVWPSAAVMQILRDICAPILPGYATMSGGIVVTEVPMPLLRGL